jgi:hypothetical protein
MTTQQPELAARLVLDIVAASIEDDDDQPLEQFLAALANDPRTINSADVQPALVAAVEALAPALRHLWHGTQVASA